METAQLQLHAEELVVTKRRVPDQLVRVVAQTRTRDVLVEEPLSQESVVIERVAVGRYVDSVPEPRQEGDVTIMPVVEEEVVVTRRLFLREEVHIRRVRTTTSHVETITLREQHVVVTREEVQPNHRETLPAAGADTASTSRRSMPMDSETIVAVYDTPAHAELAAADLRQAGIPESAISLHANSTSATMTTAPVREEGFWASLFGGESEHDTAVYDRSLAGGSTVVTVKVMEEHVAKVTEILESHSPVDIDERATGYGMTTSSMGATTTSASMMGTETSLTSGASLPGTYAGTTAPASRLADESGTLQLSEESLAVGKRLINRGGTRIRRYVVETPVEESVSLHSEKVTLERHPVTDGRPVPDASFSEKVIEMTETAEEAVVSKTARVVEEVGLRKEASDRVETIHDTVRKEEVEIEQIPGTTTTTTTIPGTFKTPGV